MLVEKKYLGWRVRYLKDFRENVLFKLLWLLRLFQNLD